MSEKHVPETLGKGLLIVGWIFAFLGGLIGIAIGASIWNGKVKLSDGTKVPKYDESSRAKGKIIMTVGIVMFVLGNVLRSMG